MRMRERETNKRKDFYRRPAHALKRRLPTRLRFPAQALKRRFSRSCSSSSSESSIIGASS